jgi:hypothetical protein
VYHWLKIVALEQTEVEAQYYDAFKKAKITVVVFQISEFNYKI